MKSWVPQWRTPRARTVVVVIAALVLAGAGVGGYMIGKQSGADLDDVARVAIADGHDAGLKKGAKEGYARGFEGARGPAYASAYSAAYRRAFAAEFEAAGLEPPARIPVPERR
jgi:hypothetical protein